MRVLLLGLILLNLTTTTAQDINTIKAVMSSDIEYFETDIYDANGEPIGELEFLFGCSWYCAGSVDTIFSSSHLTSNNGIEYVANNAHDFNKNTAWIEGKDDFGIGEFIEYDFNFDSENGHNSKLGITKIILANGYKKSLEIWKANSRVKRLKMYVNGIPYALLDLEDYFEIQTLDIGTIMFPIEKTTKIRFEILEIYPGDKYKDTAISLLMFDGVGDH